MYSFVYYSVLILKEGEIFRTSSDVAFGALLSFVIVGDYCPVSYS